MEKVAKLIPDLVIKSALWDKNPDKHLFPFMENKNRSRVFLSTSYVFGGIESVRLKLLNQKFIKLYGKKDGRGPDDLVLIMGITEDILDKTTSLSVSIEALDFSIRGTRLVTYDEKVGGVKQEWGHTSPGSFDRGRFFNDIPRLGCLPQVINVRETAIAFIEQVKARNFSKPKLILP